MKEIYSTPAENIKESSKIVGKVAKRTLEAPMPYWRRSLQRKTARILDIFSKKTF